MPTTEISPVPTEEEAAVIAAVIEAMWPKPVVLMASNGEHETNRSAWRFSGRWWSRPVAARRDRPWM